MALPATGAERAAWLVLAPPAAGAVILLLGGRRTNRWGHVAGVLMPVAAFGYGLAVFAEMLGQGQRGRELTLFTWIVAGRFHVTAGLLLDQLSICFVLLITGVASLIHIFAVGYMEHDPERRRFFGYNEPVRDGDAGAGAGRQLRAAVRRLGGGRPGPPTC